MELSGGALRFDNDSTTTAGQGGSGGAAKVVEFSVSDGEFSKSTTRVFRVAAASFTWLLASVPSAVGEGVDGLFAMARTFDLYRGARHLQATAPHARRPQIQMGPANNLFHELPILRILYVRHLTLSLVLLYHETKAVSILASTKVTHQQTWLLLPGTALPLMAE